MGRVWHIGNTTVRNPHRLKAGLEALLAAGFEGDMGKSREYEMAKALDRAGVISLLETTKDVTSIARKWRGALIKVGFLRPDVSSRSGPKGVIQSEIGTEYTVTPNGRRLLSARSFQAEQEIFLRALSAFELPSAIESGYSFRPFSPLRYVLQIIFGLEARGADALITRLEMACVVIRTSPDDGLGSVIDEILTIRSHRSQSKSKKKFDGELKRSVADRIGVRSSTLNDYQDVSFRYLKATGLFNARGRAIALVPEKRLMAELLVENPLGSLPAAEYLLRLGDGAFLPTDDYVSAREIVADLVNLSRSLGIDFNFSGYDTTSTKELSSLRFDLEDAIFRVKESRFANEQRHRIGEILAYLRLLADNKSSVMFDGVELRIPNEERPAYFEWLLWRVLLALGELVEPPHAVRRFEVDQDFLPVGPAPGGGADVIGYYRDIVLVVEVTLTENSRQEAAEGEPVRRHVARVLEELEPLGKSVYGLFVARKVDTNAAETFRIGVWYLNDDKRVSLDIVPLTISQLHKILLRGVEENNLRPALIFDVLRRLTELRKSSGGAPEWKKRIAEFLDG